MSNHTAVVTAEHIAYLAARTRRDDEFLRSLQLAAGGAGIPSISIAPEQGSLVQILLVATRALEVVEVGTLAGYAAIWMARALRPGGRVTSIEFDPTRAAFAREWIARSDVADRIRVIEGDARVRLREFSAASVDAVFLDADKSSYRHYLEESARILRPGGLVLVDNAFAFGQLFDSAPRDREVPAIRDFNDHMARDARFQSVIVPIGDGLWVGVKL